MIKTLAVQRLDTFFKENYDNLFKAAAMVIGSVTAGDVVNDTYIKLLQKERRGCGHYSSDFENSYEDYIYGALNGTLKSYKKLSPEILETELLSNMYENDTSFFSRISTGERFDELYTEADSMDIITELVAVCTDCGTDVYWLVNALKTTESLNKSALAKLFAPLRRAARRNSSIINTVSDFMRIYGDNPHEVECCLAKLIQQHNVAV